MWTFLFSGVVLGLLCSIACGDSRGNGAAADAIFVQTTRRVSDTLYGSASRGVHSALQYAQCTRLHAWDDGCSQQNNTPDSQHGDSLLTTAVSEQCDGCWAESGGGGGGVVNHYLNVECVRMSMIETTLGLGRG